MDNNFSDMPSSEQVVIFIILLKQINKRIFEGDITMLKGALIILMMSLFTENSSRMSAGS